MKNKEVSFLWNQPAAARHFQAAVSLHSHTSASKESLEFINNVARSSGLLRMVLEQGRVNYRRHHGREMDLNRAWWTPPVTPRDGHELEARQIVDVLGLAPMVSLTDHDTIEAPQHLRLLEAYRHIPISVEWTVPFDNTFFHIGVHNLPEMDASRMMQELGRYIKFPDENRLPQLLEWLHAQPETLIVLNHPLWDEKGVGKAAHLRHLDRLLNVTLRWVHALELNGLRPWKENQQTIERAHQSGIPLVSGGDRHSREPNAVVNLTNASTFSEFVEEVRNGDSRILFMPQYSESLRLRFIHNICDVLREDPSHGLGWSLWSDRVFYEGKDHVVRSLTEIWGSKPPAAIRYFVNGMTLLEHKRFRSALRYALQEPEEFAS